MGSNAAKPFLNSILGVAAGLALAACSSDSAKEPDPNIFPTSYKQEILDTLMTTLPDPTNVREAFIAQPVLVTIEKTPRYMVCIRFNSRNAGRQYAGSKDHVGIFYAGHLNQLIDSQPDQCTRAAYQPFPELEKLCLATKCP